MREFISQVLHKKLVIVKSQLGMKEEEEKIMWKRVGNTQNGQKASASAVTVSSQSLTALSLPLQHETLSALE